MHSLVCDASSSGSCLVVLVVIGVLASRIVNVNRFSLHGMYRNRLVRAYLGASNYGVHGDGAARAGSVHGIRTE